MKTKIGLAVMALFVFAISWTGSPIVRADAQICTPGEIVYTQNAYCNIISPEDGDTVMGTVPVVIEYSGCAGEVCDCQWIGDVWVCGWEYFEEHFDSIYLAFVKSGGSGRHLTPDDGLEGTITYNWETIDSCNRGEWLIGATPDGYYSPPCQPLGTDMITVTVSNPPPEGIIVKPENKEVFPPGTIQVDAEFHNVEPNYRGIKRIVLSWTLYHKDYWPDGQSWAAPHSIQPPYPPSYSHTWNIEANFPGTRIILKVIVEDDCYYKSESEEIEVSIDNEYPVASFTYSPGNPVVDEEITFDASSSYDPDGEIVSYEWDFGDGSSAESENEAVTHAYNELGEYTVTLTVTDNYGLTDSTQNNIIIENRPPIASFTYFPQNPLVGENITFDASSSYDPDGEIVSYEWDFGDGNSAESENETVTHAYNESGTYTVTLTVTDNYELTDSTQESVGISIPILWVAPGFAHFGAVPVGSASSMPFSIINVGKGDKGLEIGSISIKGKDASEFSILINLCSGETLMPGERICLLNVVFAPGSEGEKKATLSIKSNDPYKPTVWVPLRGIGVGKPRLKPIPNVSVNGLLNPKIHKFPNGDLINIGGSVTIPFDIHNMSNEPWEWWFCALTPYGKYWLNPSLNWVKSDNPISIGQYPLFELSETIVLSRQLPEGNYTFYFVLDDNPDGIIDITASDYAGIIIVPKE